MGLTVGGEAAGHDGVAAALLIAAMLIVVPLLGTMYIAAQHGIGNVPLWFKLHLSHSSPHVCFFYLPAEERCAMRQKLRGRRDRALAPKQAVADEEFGSRRRPGPLMPSPTGRAPPAAIVTAQVWLEKAENDADSGSSC